ncbi:hypothetical protein [Hyphomicrobium sp.]|uniref:hypothetical protein n=1 Tax=Hyphomicrobium sp. TaxID=82 RepID=UPI002FE2F6F7
MSDFDKRFASNTKLAAPIQLDRQGWKLRALRQLSARNDLSAGGAMIVVGGLLLTSTIAPYFAVGAAVVGAGSVLIGRAVRKNGIRSFFAAAADMSLPRPEAEVTARHAKTPQGPRV